MSQESTARSVAFAVSVETSAAPADVIEIAGKDFSPQRAEIWPNVRSSRLVVHEVSANHVDVTEGGTGPARFIWERCRYEWPEPGLIKATVIDSNAMLPGSTFQLRATPDGAGSAVEMVLDRRFRSGGWGAIGYALNRVAGEGLFRSMLGQAMESVEKRLAEREAEG